MDILEHKEASFYTDYFANLQDFKVLEEFAESKEEDEENLYVGYVEVLNTIHPLVIRVEIPFTFPHHKLTFRTKSLSGYPHLIHNGKIKYGDWFCLNTPFAETATEQLNQEVHRLKRWIHRMMRSELPAIIKDENVKYALLLANVYDWENPDEVNEFSSKASLTFVGNFHSNPDFFKEKMGFINCIKTPDNRFYALSNKSLCNYKLPYIIVTEYPTSNEVMSDFIRLKRQYEWDDKVCEHLLPDFGMSELWWCSGETYNYSKWTEYDALSKLKELERELSKDISYLPGETITTQNSRYQRRNFNSIKVLPVQKPVLLNEIQRLKEQVLKDHGYISYFKIPNYDGMSPEEKAKAKEQEHVDEYLIAEHEYKYHHFAFGVKIEDAIEWYIIYTSRAGAVNDEVHFDLGLVTTGLNKVVSHELICNKVQIVSDAMYFGRGSFSEKLRNKRIALIGLGAIGSMVASSLAHSGVSKIGLWDEDIVEPGNICRSSYCLRDLGESKVNATAAMINSINPFIDVKQICKHGIWMGDAFNPNDIRFINGSFYGNINYRSQGDVVNEIKGYDLIIDCTASNEMLHFLSYAVPESDIISMCITNHADDLLCISSKDGNPFELRKSYLSRIEQDTKNFYVEGEGCYSPTFLATNSDITSLVNLALRNINKAIKNDEPICSTIYSYSDRGILADKLSTYKLDGYDIILNIPSETMLDAEDMDDAPDGQIGYVFGRYSMDGKQIMITHIVDASNAYDLLTDAYKTSKGLIDYIGDYSYSGTERDTYRNESLELIAAKAYDPEINTKNPLLAVRNPDGSVSFFLYINNELVRFSKIS